jgi:hypothetical protein
MQGRLGINSGAVHFPIMPETLSLIPSTTKNENKKGTSGFVTNTVSQHPFFSSF